MIEMGESNKGKITFKKFKKMMQPDKINEDLIEKASTLIYDDVANQKSNEEEKEEN